MKRNQQAQDTIVSPGSPAPLPSVTAKVPSFSGNVLPQPIAANSTVTLQTTGSHVYLLVCSLASGLLVRLRGADWVGEYAPAFQGTGFDVPDGSSPFTSVDIQNPSNIAVSVQVWCGFGNFRDQRLILPAAYPNITFPVYSKPTAAFSASVQIPDRSGQQITDSNGNTWLAIQRVKIVFSNMDAANNWLLQKYASAAYNDGSAALNIPASTDIEHDSGGSLSLWGNNGQVQGLITEVYQCVPVNVTNL